MKFYFVRHGESEANLLWEFSNSLGKHGLTEKGRGQALALARSLQSIEIARIYTSPILRALQTAHILSRELGVPYEITDALREFDVGVLEGKSDEASWQAYWQIIETWLLRREWEQRLEQGESFLDIQRRFVPFIENLVQEKQPYQENLLLVGHGGAYRCMLPLVLSNIDFQFARDSHLGNTAVVIAEARTDGLVCLEWGEIHLM